MQLNQAALRAFALIVIGVLLTVAFAQAQEERMTPAAAPASSACLAKLAQGVNRFKVKLPLAGLKKLNESMARKLAGKIPNKLGRLKTTDMALFVDYTKNSRVKRGFMIDFKACDLATADYTAHGGATYRPYRRFDGDPNDDGMLDYCLRRDGTRQNMTRPGFFVTGGCHVTRLPNWPYITSHCHGVKLHGQEDRNSDAFTKGVVLHEHEGMNDDDQVKAVGQGCPIFAPGRLRALMRYDLLSGMAVYLHAPQCDSGSRSSI